MLRLSRSRSSLTSSSLLTIRALHLDKGNGPQREPSVQSTDIVLEATFTAFT